MSATGESFVEQEDSKVKVWMPWYIGDYLRDTQGLSAEEHGAYFLLVMALWMNGGFLPNHPRRLARIACIDFERWPDVWTSVSRFFHVEDDRVWQKRALEELEKAHEQRRKNVERSQAANAAKRAKSAKASGAPVTSDHQGDLQGTSAVTSKETFKVTPSPSPSPAPSEAPAPPGGDPERPREADRNGQIRTPHDLMQAFAYEWRETYQGWWKPDTDAIIIARKLLEEGIDKLPPEPRAAAYADIRNRIRSYFGDKDHRLVARRHPFRWFCDRWNSLGGPAGPPKTYAAVPAEFPRAKQLP